MLLIKNEKGVFLLPLWHHFEMDRIDITHLSNKVTDDGKTVVTASSHKASLAEMRRVCVLRILHSVLLFRKRIVTEPVGACAYHRHTDTYTTI